MMQFRFWPIYGALALLALLPVMGCSDLFDSNAVESFHATVSMAPATIEVHNPAGTLVVDAWTKRGVQIDAQKRGRTIEDVHAITISVQPRGQTLVVTSHFPPSIDNGHVEYTIHAPASTNLDLHESAGNLEAHGFNRDVDASLSAGKLAVTMASVGGTQRVSLRLSVGTLELSVPSTADATVAADTSVGGVHSDFPLTIARDGVGQSANGRIGKGTARVELTNSTGAIRITRE
jgi:hypothetical protein